MPSSKGEGADMETEVAYIDDAATVAVKGQLNTNTAGDFERKLASAFSRTHALTLDFAQLDYVSSAGLRVLVGAQKQVTKAGGSMRIANVIDDVREVFEITGLIDVFDVR